jgi:hypothetical protein
MSSSARTVLLFGVYLMALGIILLITPNFLLELFSIPSTTEVWIRVAGMLILCLGFLYAQAARNNITEFFHWTVFIRSSVIVFLSVFVVLGFVSPTVIRLISAQSLA